MPTLQVNLIIAPSLVSMETDRVMSHVVMRLLSHYIENHLLIRHVIMRLNCTNITRLREMNLYLLESF